MGEILFSSSQNATKMFFLPKHIPITEKLKMNLEMVSFLRLCMHVKPVLKHVVIQFSACATKHPAVLDQSKYQCIVIKCQF